MVTSIPSSSRIALTASHTLGSSSTTIALNLSTALSSDRQPHGKCRSLAHGALDLDVAAVFFDDTIAHGQTQAGSLGRVLCREEGIEDLVQVLLGDARAAYPKKRSRRGFPLMPGADLDPAGRRDRMNGVQQHVHDDLADLRRVRHDLGEVVGSFSSSAMPLNASWAASESAISETGWLILILSGLITVSRPKLSSCRTMFRARFVSRAMSFSLSWRGSDGRALLEHQVREGQHRSERIVDLVRDAGGKLADGRQLFRLHELVLLFPQLLDDLLERRHGIIEVELHLVEGDGEGGNLVLPLDLDASRKNLPG